MTYLPVDMLEISHKVTSILAVLKQPKNVNLYLENLKIFSQIEFKTSNCNCVGH